MEELKPCPFCGGDARVQKVNAIVGVKFTVCCGNCYCMGHETTYLVNTREKAVEAWNLRANECDKDDILETLDKMVEESKRTREYCIGDGLTIKRDGLSESDAKRYATWIKEALVVER